MQYTPSDATALEEFVRGFTPPNETGVWPRLRLVIAGRREIRRFLGKVDPVELRGIDSHGAEDMLKSLAADGNLALDDADMKRLIAAIARITGGADQGWRPLRLRLIAQVLKQMQVSTLINMHRVRGHLIADLDPLSAKPPEMHPELDPATYGLTIWDLDREFLTGGDVGIYASVGGTRRLPLGDILGILRDAYCRTVGIEYMHIQEPEEKRWIQEQVEGAPTKLPVDDQRHILGRLNSAEALEKFYQRFYLRWKPIGRILKEMSKDWTVCKRRLREGKEFFQFMLTRKGA